MKFEVGKKYTICNLYKKSLEESELWKKGPKTVGQNTLWRAGSFDITPQNQDECDYLDEAWADGTDGELFVNDFEDWEMIDAWDGISEEFDDEDLEDEYLEQLENEEDWPTRYDFMTERGYEEKGCEFTFYAGIMVEAINDKKYEDTVERGNEAQ